MPLVPGTRLGPYEVIAAIGAGGMGEVYRARDTALNRDVALKVLPDTMADDPDRLARFRREAEALAVLNHPNIAQVFGLEISGDSPAIVMELVEGDDLSHRIAHGAMPIEDALPIARQIVEALEAAHEAGIIHRDLKPANIKVKEDGTVKVLDFGLAKAFGPDATSAAADDLANSPTLTARATQMGMILGTASYMAPEQAKGKHVDKRADVWAFGVVLFEMLTGQRPFGGDDVSEVMARVISHEPDWTALPATIPRTIERLLRRCLVKARKDRLPDIVAARLDIDDAANEPASVSLERADLRHGRRWQALTFVAAAAALALALGLGWVLTRPEATRSVARFESFFRDGQVPASFAPGAFDLSHDGDLLVYRGPGRALWMRRWEELDATPIPGAEGGNQPAISPDNRWLAFWQLGQIKVLSMEGGVARPLFEGSWPRWGPDGMIYASVAGGISRVPAAGGTPESVLNLRPGETSAIVAGFLPGGAALIHVLASDGSSSEIRAVGPASGESTTLMPGAWPRYAASGHLTFIAPDGSLVAAPFDANTLTLSGLTTRMVAGVASYAISETGHLIYTTSLIDREVEDTELVWMTRSGVISPVEAGWRFDRGGIRFGWRLSPGGTSIAFTRQTGVNLDIWIKDLPSGPLRRLTTDPADQWAPWWTPDGEHVSYVSDPVSNVWSSKADETGDATLILDAGGFAQGLWSPDGEWLVLRTAAASAFGAQGLRSIVAFRPGVDTAVVLLLATEFAEHAPALSPDGRWLAYVSDETGREEVYVRPFPDVNTSKANVSLGRGGSGPRWARDGSQLFFLRGDTMVAARVETEPGFRVLGEKDLFEVPREVLSVGSASWMGANNFYDVAPDGRFLMGRRVPVLEDPATQTYVLVQNFAEQLKRLVPDKN